MFIVRINYIIIFTAGDIYLVCTAWSTQIGLAPHFCSLLIFLQLEQHEFDDTQEQSIVSSLEYKDKDIKTKTVQSSIESVHLELPALL